MLTHPARTALMGLAVTASLIGCSTPKHDGAGVSAAAAAQARALGARLAAQDRAERARHRAEIARLVRTRVIGVDEADRTMTIRFTVENLSTKTMRRVEAGFIVRGNAGRIASCELRDAVSLAPHASRTVTLAIPYTQFGSDTGPMREAVGKPQRYALDVTEIKYADGSDAGYDD